MGGPGPPECMPLRLTGNCWHGCVPPTIAAGRRSELKPSSKASVSHSATTERSAALSPNVPKELVTAPSFRGHHRHTSCCPINSCTALSQRRGFPKFTAGSRTWIGIPREHEVAGAVGLRLGASGRAAAVASKVDVNSAPGAQEQQGQDALGGPVSEAPEAQDALGGARLNPAEPQEAAGEEDPSVQSATNKQPPGLRIGFTRRNELLVGRTAMVGFGASLVGEALTGKGPLAQLKMETGIPIYEAEPLLLFFILFTLVGAVRGIDGRGAALFVDESERRQQELIRPRAQPSSLRGWLGLREEGPLFSFSTANELFVGRLAQLGFACALIGEIITGKGALAQLRIETGIPVTEVEPLLILSIAFFFLSAINPETGRFFRNEDDEL